MVSSSASSVAPTSFVTTHDLPTEIAHLPFEASVSQPGLGTVDVYFGEGEMFRPRNKTDSPSSHPLSRFAEVLKCRLRQAKTTERDPKRVEPRKDEKDCQSQQTHRSVNPAMIESHESYFASSGTVGVVDLGASQTVIGSQQIPELLQRLHLTWEIRSNVLIATWCFVLEIIKRWIVDTLFCCRCPTHGFALP